MEAGDFYDEAYFDSMERRYHTGAHGERAHDIAANIPGGVRLLDYGCGSGYFSEVARNKGCNVTAYDFSESAARYVEKTYPKIRVSRNLNEIGGGFDAVIALDIIEHLDYPMQSPFLLDLKNRLKPGGRLVISTDNIESFFSKHPYGAKLQHLDSRLTRQGRAYRKIKKEEAADRNRRNYHSSHVGLLARNEVIALARDAGFRLEGERHGFFYASPLSTLVSRLTKALPLHSVYLFSRP